MDDVRAFMETYLDRDRQILAERLQRISDRVAELGPRIQQQGGGDGEWSAHEILAHLAVVSKFYGVLVHRIAAGKLDDLNLLEAVNMRDAAGKQMSELDPAELLRMTLADHQRTITTLRTTDPASLQNAARGRTTLVIAHRLSTFREADSLVVMEHGRLVEEGTWETLESAGGVFEGLVRGLAV